MVRIRNLVDIYADKLIKEGKFTKEQRKQAIEESIKDLSQRHKNAQGRGWGGLMEDVGIPPKNLSMLVTFASHILDPEEVSVIKRLQKNLEKQGLDSEEALKIIILARYKADEKVTKEKIQKNPDLKVILLQHEGILQESAKYFLEKKQKGASWEELAPEVGMNKTGLNKLSDLMAVQVQG